MTSGKELVMINIYYYIRSIWDFLLLVKYITSSATYRLEEAKTVIY